MTDIRHVIIIGVDGLRPDQINAQTMPNLTAMRERGVSSTDHRTVFPSETRGALSALANGARPESTGVLGNEFYPRDGRNRLSGTDTLHDWRYGEANFLGGMVNTIGMNEALAKSGKAFAVVNSSGQGSFTALNWKGDALGQTSFNVRYPQIAFPHDLALEISQRHKVPSVGFDRGAQDQVVGIFTQSVWPARKPNATIIWMNEVDSASHRHGLGAEGQLESMIGCDKAIGDLLDWREHQPERDAIAVFVTSDHGHSTIAGKASIGDVLAAAGISAATQFDDGVDIVYRRGRAPGLWLRKYDNGLLQAAYDALLAQEWYGATFTRAVEPGSHLGEIDGTLAISLTGAGHFRAPDLYINMRGDDLDNAHGIAGTSICDMGSYNIELGGGTHGGLHWSELAAVMIADGAGLRSGGQAIASRTGIDDIAPTALHMLGVQAPNTMTGRVMHELLENGEPVPAPIIEEYTATAGGKTSHIRFGRVGERRYVDEATVSSAMAGADQQADRETVAAEAPAE